jgi:hypothetical protein
MIISKALRTGNSHKRTSKELEVRVSYHGEFLKINKKFNSPQNLHWGGTYFR